MRILIIEDHKDSAVALSRLLTLRDHDVAIAGTLAQARAMCQPGTFDLLLCDITLPDGDGWELADYARACGARAIALTGHGMEDEVARIASAGFESHLLKPINAERLDRAIAGV